MATFAFDPAALNVSAKFGGGPYTPAAIRAYVTHPMQDKYGEQQSHAVVVNGSAGFVGATLTALGSAAWLTVPATCDDGVAFSIDIDATALKPGDYTETVRVSAGGFTDAELPITLAVRPMG